MLALEQGSKSVSVLVEELGTPDRVEASSLGRLRGLDLALDRGATIYAEVIGYGMSGDGYHMTSPSPDGDGAVRCMAAAVDDAGIAYDDVDYINAHGTTTQLNDL